MNRPLSYVIAAAVVASTAFWSLGPTTAAQMPTSVAPGSPIQTVGYRDGNWNYDNWNNDRGRDDNWRHRHHRHRRHQDDFFPGFSFSFGAPFAYAPRYYYPPQDCFRDQFGRLYCSGY